MVIELYGNTGFSSIERPEDIDLVRSSGNLIARLNNYNIIQSNNLAEITVKGITESEADRVDYIICDTNGIETAYVLQDKGYKYESKDCVTFYLIRDAWCTFGGFKDGSGNHLISATANRMSVADDDDNYYTEIEPFKPSERCTCIEGTESGSLDPTMTDSTVNILETVVSPPKLCNSMTGMAEPQISENITSVTTGCEVHTTHDGVIGVMSPSVPSRNTEGNSTGEQLMITEDPETNEINSISRSVLITPLFRMITQTIYRIGKLFSGETVIRTGTMWWNGDNMSGTFTDIKGKVHNCSVLKDLRDSGAENGATAFWAVNSNYIESMNDAGYSPSAADAGGIKNIKSKTYNQTALFRTTNVNYKNNKIYYGQALTIKVFSPVSGKQLDKQAFEIRNPDCKPSDKLSKCDYSISADIRSGGCPIFAWKYFNGEDQTESYMETIDGGNWRQIPLAAVGNPGSIEGQIALDKQSDMILMNSMIAGTSGAIAGAKIGAMVGGVPSAVVGGIIGGIGSGVASYYGQTTAIQEQQALLDSQGNKASVALALSSSKYLRDIGKNSFYNLFVIYSENDIAAFDRFLTLYGYKVNNKVFTEDDFYSRPSFNFVRLNEAIIKTENKNNRLKEEVIKELKYGIRIWHEMPNETAIINGNK